MNRAPIFHVITPTFRRSSMLRRFLGALRQQSYPLWTGYVVHDGPSTKFQNDYLRRAVPDERVRFAMTARRTGDTGCSQRLQAMAEANAGSGADDYFVLWDDDNYFYPAALASIAENLASTGFPDLLLVPLRYRGGVIPPAGRNISDLTLGDLDTGCLVLRASCFEAIRPQMEKVVDGYLFDFSLFKAVRELGAAVVTAHAMEPVGMYDGLRHAQRYVANRPRAQWAIYWLSFRRLLNAAGRFLRNGAVLFPRKEA